LRQNRLTPKEFENEIRQQLRISRIKRLVQDEVKYTDNELWGQFVWENEKINLSFIEIDPNMISTKDGFGDKEIKDFYDKHQEEFLMPDKIKIAYLEFYPKNFKKRVEISQKDIEDYYKEFPEEFWQPKKVHARHILIKVDPDAKKTEKENARKKAEKTLSMIKSGGLFEEIAKQYSQDKATAGKGGDLGFFSRGQMVKPFEEAAFKLKPGEVSGIVETKFGYHIIKVEEIEEEGAKPLEKVKQKIQENLTEEKARELAKKEAYRAYRTALKTKDLKGYAEKKGLKVMETDYFSRDRDYPFFINSEEILEEMFSLKPGDIAYPLLFNDRYYIIKLLSKKESHIPNLEEIKEKIISLLKKKEQKEVARAKAEGLLKKLLRGDPMEEIAKEEKLTLEETGFFPRSKGRIPNIGDSPAMMAASFRLTAARPYPEKVFEVNGKYYLIKFKQREKAKKAEFKDKEKENRKKYTFQKREEYLDDWLKNARIHADVAFNPRVNP